MSHIGFFTGEPKYSIGVEIECPECNSPVDRMTVELQKDSIEIGGLQTMMLRTMMPCGPDAAKGTVTLSCGCVLNYRLMAAYFRAYTESLRRSN